MRAKQKNRAHCFRGRLTEEVINELEGHQDC